MVEVIEKTRLTRQQKKELGILPAQVLANAKDAGITKEMSAEEKAFVYACYAADQSEFMPAWKACLGGTYGVDWDSIIEFLTKLMEMLMIFLPLFI